MFGLFDENLKAVRAINRDAARLGSMSRDDYEHVLAMCDGHDSMYYQAERQRAESLYIAWRVKQGEPPVLDFPASLISLPGEVLRGSFGATPEGDDIVGTVYVTNQRILLQHDDGRCFAWAYGALTSIRISRDGSVRVYDAYGGCTPFTLFIPEYCFGFSALAGLLMGQEVAVE